MGGSIASMICCGWISIELEDDIGEQGMVYTEILDLRRYICTQPERMRELDGRQKVHLLLT